MKSLFTLIFIILCITTNATTYYISASGNDANNGTSTSSPWQTINKLNSFFSSLKPGDNVFFNRGDVFKGSVTVNKSGSSGNVITIGAYGVGANPVITGLNSVTAWTNLGSNIWESTGAVSTLSSMNMVVINGINTPIGRYPNTGYITYQSGSNNSLTSSSLGATNWTGASVMVRKNKSSSTTCPITNQSGTTLTFSDDYQGSAPATAGYGFFIQNDIRTLDKQNEWYYNPSTKKIDIFSTVAPSNVQVSTITNVISNNSFDYVTFSDLTFTGGNDDGINLSAGTEDFITVKNCEIGFNGNEGFENNSTAGDSVYNCYIHDNGQAGLFTLGKIYAANNYIYNSGVIQGQSPWDTRNVGIFSTGDLSVFINNVVRNTGCDGICMTGSNFICQYNWVDSTVLVNNDNGGIYCSKTGVYRLIDHNIVTNTIGNPIGTPSPGSYYAEGLYLDESCTHITATNNTIAYSGASGIKIHTSFNNRLENNTVFSSTEQQLRLQGGSETVADTLRYNIYVSKNYSTSNGQQWCSNITNTAGTFSSMGIWDYNYYVRPLDNNQIITSQVNSNTNQTLVAWQSYSTLDKHSLGTPKTTANGNDIILVYNTTTSPVTTSLPYTYIDVKNVSYNGSITLAPYTSAVLIKNGASTNQSPVANAGQDQTITLPTNTVTLSGSGSDADGTISSYAWTKISGPSTYTIVNATSAGTSVTGLVQGVYQFQLKVTDNNGATGTDTMQVTVNPANIPPVANAGQDQTITLPTNSLTLAGSGSDADGTISSYNWTKISGPSTYNIVNSASPGTSVTGLVQGVYQFQLTVTDNNGATGTDTMQVTVNPAPNQPPVANAGSDQTITLPANSVTLAGNGSDADGTVVGYAWTEISGPASYNIVNANSANTGITGLVQGVYQFQLIVTDNDGATGTDVVVITVNPAANIPPVANAGLNQSITLPVNTVTFSGSGSDADGTIVGYTWTEVSGPASYNIVNANAAATDVTGLVQGTYQFQLQVTDNDGAIGTNIIQVTVSAAPNIPPVANAGSNQSITLPVNTVTLSGNGSDADGTVVSYSWTELSGPLGYTIVNANSTGTDVTSLVQGTYQFQLTVTDNNGATGTDVVVVTVNPAANTPPVANAGADQVTTLPNNTITLSGSGSDADGTVVGYVWTELSGPSNYSFVNANSPVTDVSGLVQGVYQFQLQVTDNGGATGTDVIQVTVNPAPNQPPVANAGSDQNITLPTNSVTLAGSGSDADGTVVGYTWTEISGPASYNIVNANLAGTDVTGLVQGTYQFQLTVTDNNGATGIGIMQVIVNPAADIPPVANAGSNQSITLPVNTVTLSGSGSDADGTIAGYVWTKISGPATYNIANANSAGTDVTGLVQGVYQFQLQVTDNDGAIGTDIIRVTVNAAPNIPPVADAGSNQSITLPVNVVTLSGSGSDADGTVVNYSWTKISGPSGYTIVNSNSPGTNVTGLVQGTYQFQLTVTDNDGATGSGIIQVIVNPAPNIPPVANAGGDQIITLPVNTVTLSGSGSDADGTVVSYTWTELSGPSGYSIINANSPVTDVTGLVQGVYQFQLQVADNDGAIGTDIIQITVNPASNIPPVANAGVDQTITLPTNSVAFSGSGTDADGIVVSYAWTKISGPVGYNIVDATLPSTSVTGLTQGVYQFELQVTDDNGAISADTIQVTVNAATNIPPVANAGVDQTITLPTNIVTLSGSGTDADGTIAGYTWTEISGPASYNIVNAISASTNVTGLVQGVYQFELKVTDNNGATGTDTVQVTVNIAGNISPVANAGSDKTITLPVNTVTLSGSGSDADGTVVAYAWTEISGPSAYNIVNATSPATSITGLVQGVYQFQLEVTDNSGATGTDLVQVTVNAAPNIPPVANAGSDWTITLPINSVTLSGSGSDADGTVVAYTWTKISGPSTYNIVNATSATTDITGLVHGVYKFQLRVTDNNGATGTDVVKVTVNTAANIPPVANAGVDQSVTLPVNTVSLAGSGTDADGTVVSYAWTKISGPTSYSIANPASAGTNINGLVQGIYQFQLKVTDNNGATGTDIVLVTVNAAPNQPPVANAGSDQTITLPINSVTLTGTGTDADGTVAGYAWTEISGPSGYNIVNTTSPSTSVTGLVQGVYQFQLEVTDNDGATGTDVIQVTVNAAPNQPPVANAGTDKTITLPTNSLIVTGSGTDADGTVASYTWTKISGPSGYSIVNPANASTNITGLVQGVYQFQLKVTDNDGATGTDIMQVTVNAAPNQPPVANAGSDQTITLPTNSVTLSGIGSDADGIVVGYIWTKISGPSGYSIVNGTSSATAVTGLVQGVYQFQLKVTDNNGATGTDVIQVTVNAAPNQPPVANAGTDKTITLPTNSLTVTGSGTDADGTVASYAWTKISGPSGYSIVNPAAASTDITGLVQGVYQFELKVTDNNGATGTDVMQVTVKAAPNQPPVANAGSDKTITLPTNSLTVTGSGTDADGTVVGYAWTKISGPSSYSIINPASASTNITGLVQGVYQFQLRVTDNSGATGIDVMQVTVNAAPNQPPVANAGSDKVITLPTNSLTITGSGTDADGTVVSYAWTKVSGPASYNIVNATSSATNISGLVQGVYQFQLKVTDNDGATGTNIMQVTVNAAPNQPPAANAGPDKTITLPTNSLTVSGSATDVDGTVVGYQWTKISGPASYNIVSSTSAVTDINGLAQGVYQFELRATDNNGARGRDTMQVTVNAAVNIAPVAHAGSDQTITLPVNTASLAGSGIDADGTVVSYLWTKISGPSTYNITNATSPVTDVSGLVQGVYKFEIKVTDNDGATGRDTIQITVRPAINAAPVADAGPDQTITLPTNSVTLSGSGTYVNGTITGYSWKQVSGPSTTVMASPGNAVTVSNGLVGGTYQFELTVTDNYGVTATDTVSIVVAEPRLNPNAQSNEIKAYPNPVVDITTLEINTTQLYDKLMLVITDMDNHIVYKNQITPGQTNIKEMINMGNLAKGTYAITVYYSDKEKQSIKVIRL